MSNPIGFNELFNFDDSTPIDEAIKKIEKLNEVYETLIEQATKNSANYTQSISEILGAAKKLEDQIKDLDAADKAHQETIVKGAQQAEDLLKGNQELRKAQKLEEDQLAVLIDLQKKLAAANEKLKKTFDAEAGSINDIKTKLAQANKEFVAMGDATSEAVKKETLDKISQLSKELATAERAVKEARKATEHAAGSYNDLASRVAEAKRRMKEMEGGIGSTSKEFLKLKKFAADGTEQLKKFDNVVGDNQRKVGDYAGEISKISPRLGAMAGGFQDVSRAAWALVSNPVVLVLAAIALAIVGITKAATAYFEGSIEGQDRLSSLTADFNGILEISKQRVERLGEGFVDLFTNPKKAFTDFGNFITDWWKDFTDLASAGWDVLASGFSVEAANKFIKVYQEVYKEEIAILAASNKATELANRLRKEKLVDIVEDGRTEVSVNELLERSKNKLKYSDEQRFTALRRANKLLREQTEGDLELLALEIEHQKELFAVSGFRMAQGQSAIDLLYDEKAIKALTYEEVEKLVNLEAAYLKLQSDASVKRKALLEQEITLVQEVEREKAALKKQEQDIENSLQAFIVQGRINANKEILADDRSTFDQKYEALANIQEAQNELAAQTRDKELSAAKDAAIERIQLSEETLDKIYSNESLSVADRIALVREEKEKILEVNASTDSIYMAQVEKTSAEYIEKIKAADLELQKALEKNIFTELRADWEALTADIAAQTATQLLQLEDAYKAGNINLSTILRERGEIEKQGRAAALIASLDYLDKQRESLEQFGHDTTAIGAKIAEQRLALSKMTTDEIIANEQRLRENIEAIGWEVFDTVATINAGRIDRNISELERQLEAEAFNKEASLRIVQDDAQAKAFIEESSANRTREIQKQIAAEKRRAAVFQKAADAASVTINTAKGIATAVTESPLTFGLPWSAFVAITGGLQLARILATPIPAFAAGTPYSPEGWALVAEAGREIVRDPSGKSEVVSGPQIRYLREGSQVIPNSPTEQLLRDARNYGDGYLADQVIDRENFRLPGKDTLEAQIIKGAIDASRGEIVAAIKSAPSDYFDEKGYRRYENTVSGRVTRLDKRYKI